jgi:hypothetical protein
MGAILRAPCAAFSGQAWRCTHFPRIFERVWDMHSSTAQRREPGAELAKSVRKIDCDA